MTIADNYVIEAGRKVTVVDHRPYAFLFSRTFSTVPTLLADMQTAADKEPATLRYTLLSPTGATVYVSEDKSKDTETLHAKESLGYIALAPATTTDTDGDGLTDEQEQYVFHTNPSLQDTDGDGLTDTTEVLTHHTDPVKVDTDGDGAWDGHEIKDGTSPLDPAETATLVLETGSLKINHLWKQVTYLNGATYSRPVVIAKPASNKGAVSVIVQIKDVTATGFKIRLQETSVMGTPGDDHVLEDIGYMVTEAGSFLVNGVRMTAGRVAVTQETAGLMKLTTFAVPMSVAPVVLASVTTANEETVPVHVRVGNPTTNGFSRMLQEEEVADQIHGEETVSYIAWEPGLITTQGSVIEVGSKPTAVGNAPYTLTFSAPKATVPVLLADMQSVAGKEPASMRYTTLSTTGATLYVSEDKSLDTEVTHPKETLGYIAISPEQ